jgi:hypothetical protein
MFVKKTREFFFFWTKTKRERVRAFHATTSMEKVMQRGMKELEKSREDKGELTKGCCLREKKMQFFLFDFLLLDSIMHNKERKKAADLREDSSFNVLFSVAKTEEEH